MNIKNYDINDNNLRKRFTNEYREDNLKFINKYSHLNYKTFKSKLRNEKHKDYFNYFNNNSSNPNNIIETSIKNKINACLTPKNSNYKSSLFRSNKDELKNKIKLLEESNKNYEEKIKILESKILKNKNICLNQTENFNNIFKKETKNLFSYINLYKKNVFNK